MSRSWQRLRRLVELPLHRSSARSAPALYSAAAVSTASALHAAGPQHARTGPPLQGGARSFASDAAVEVDRAIYYPESEVFVGKPAPAFSAPAVVDGDIGKVSLSDYRGKYVILFFYPKDFTFVCPTEIIAFSDRAEEFEKLNTSLIAASTDTEETHLAWIKTPRRKGGLGRMRIPIIADTTKEIAARYGVLIKEAGIALRGLFIINPEGVVEHITLNSPPIGRSVDEAKRILQAVQFVAEHGEVCPADWQPGGKSMKASADESLDYFSSVHEADEAAGRSEVDFGLKIKSLHSRAEFDAHTSGDRPAVVDFFAPWCGKCRQLAPFVEQLQEQHSGVAFAKVDTTETAVQGLAEELDVKVLPSFRFYKGGKEVRKPVNGYKKRLLEEAIKELG